MATLKQKLALKELGVNGGNISKAMKVAGYSDGVSKRTDKLTKRKGWAELTDKFLSDDALAKHHHQQLNSSKLVKLYFDIDDDDEIIQEVCKKLGVELLYIKINKAKDGKTVNVKAPDFFFRDLALDKAYKIKGHYAKNDEDGTKVLIINVSQEAALKYGITPSTGNNIE